MSISFTIPIPVGPFSAATFTTALTVGGTSASCLSSAAHPVISVNASTNINNSDKNFLLVFVMFFLLLFFCFSHILRVILDLRHNVICVRQENVNQHQCNRKQPCSLYK